MAVLSGEAADVSKDTVADWVKRLPEVCAGYELSDIFNCDETGLFFRTLPSRSMVTKGDNCKGGKVAKDRITVLLCTSATGEKLRPLVIGRSQNPRCFHGNKGVLPVQYAANKKAWMTGDLFKDWLNKINNKMCAQGRKIIMMLDNCTAHPDIDLSHTKLVFLPPNTTSHLQPCDAGIIQAVKVVYRKHLLRHLLLNMDEASTASQLAKSVNIRDAILWLRLAWDTLRPETIVKCFAKCGISANMGACAIVEDSADLAPPEEDCQSILGDVTWEEFIRCDQDLASSATLDDDNWEQQLLLRARGQAGEEEESEEEEDTEDQTQSPPSTLQLHSHLTQGLDYAMAEGDSELLETLSKAISLLEKNKLTKSTKQTTMDSFLKQV